MGSRVEYFVSRFEEFSVDDGGFIGAGIIFIRTDGLGSLETFLSDNIRESANRLSGFASSEKRIEFEFDEVEYVFQQRRKDGTFYPTFFLLEPMAPAERDMFNEHYQKFLRMR